MCSESSGPCLDGGEWDLQLLNAFRLHRAQPERQEGIIQEAHLCVFLVLRAQEMHLLDRSGGAKKGKEKKNRRRLAVI